MNTICNSNINEYALTYFIMYIYGYGHTIIFELSSIIHNRDMFFWNAHSVGEEFLHIKTKYSPERYQY